VSQRPWPVRLAGRPARAGLPDLPHPGRSRAGAEGWAAGRRAGRSPLTSELVEAVWPDCPALGLAVWVLWPADPAELWGRGHCRRGRAARMAARRGRPGRRGWRVALSSPRQLHGV